MPSCWRYANSTLGDIAAADPGDDTGSEVGSNSDFDELEEPVDDLFFPDDQSETGFPTSARLTVEGQTFVCDRDSGRAICVTSPELVFAAVPGSTERVLALPCPDRQKRVLREVDVVYRAFHGPESVPRGWRVAGSGGVDRLTCYRAVAAEDYRF